jgi:hypothetical protein
LIADVVSCADTVAPLPTVVLASGEPEVLDDPPRIVVDYTVTNRLATSVRLPRCGDYPAAGFDRRVGANWASYLFLCDPNKVIEPFVLSHDDTQRGVLQIPGAEPGEYRVTLTYTTTAGADLVHVAAPSFRVE